ncbi:unnamed protein product [Timema podura]|uniref:Nucleoside-diphosphate kinase n=1 Tax=Timema podura TaxID=61482 RepID=A0ABN7NNH2_TIMPD|nr:unnamed protein product [Timema podura]
MGTSTNELSSLRTLVHTLRYIECNELFALVTCEGRNNCTALSSTRSVITEQVHLYRQTSQVYLAKLLTLWWACALRHTRSGRPAHLSIHALVGLRTSAHTLSYTGTGALVQANLTGIPAISKVLGSGKIKKVPKEEAFLYPQVTQTIYDMLTVNLNMEPVLAVDMKWISETVFVENVPQALRIFVHGPPAVGKTILSKKLCEHYKVHYLSKDNVVEEAVNKLGEMCLRICVVGKINMALEVVFAPLIEYQGDAPLALAAITQPATPDRPDPLALFSEDGICLANSNGSMGNATDFRLLGYIQAGIQPEGPQSLQYTLSHDQGQRSKKDTAKQVKEKERDQEDKEEADEEEEEEEDEMQENLEEMYDLLEEVQANMAENEGQLDDSYLMRFFKERLLSNPCQNQGYVLDGFPQVLEQARVLFENVEDYEETAEEEQDSEIPFNKKIMPVHHLRSAIVNNPGSSIVTHSRSAMFIHLGSSMVNHLWSSMVNYLGSAIVNHPGPSIVNHPGSSMVNHPWSSMETHLGSSMVTHPGSSMVN